MITLDTSGVFALLNRRDPDHAAAKKVFLADPGPHIIPAGILAEVGYLVENRLGNKVLLALLRDLDTGFAVDCGLQDFSRIGELVTRYADLPLGFTDACVAACAERNGGRVLSFDSDFRVLSREGKIKPAPG